ncbi:MAG: GTPase domain-containing protein [Methylococcaceae bacterium]|nr:GTPase domain-containing protein [Methylococcaceae bacterium]
MNEDFERRWEAARHWAREAKEAGWLANVDIAPLESLEKASPSGLFEAGSHRPLVAAFFGGTGVGKSTLLNRLAGQAIARTGVERPTSREVSIYLHESLHIRQLPAGFPVERVRIASHDDDKRRQVLWIDMPDIDSTETDNRDLVVDWLPHIDVLIYVVSPERYRDDKGWRMLREHVREHAWLFVMNQWDKGCEVQYLDFAKLLQQGGFGDPLMFRTDCREESEKRKSDDFAPLEAAIQSLADDHLIQQLESRALDARLDELRSRVAVCLAGLGEEAGVDFLRTRWAEIWRESGEELLKGLEWPMGEVAHSFIARDSSPLRRSVKLEQAETGKALSPSLLWDDWAQMQLQDAMDRLFMEADDHHLPIPPLRRGLGRVAKEASRWIPAEAQKALRLALANPGNALQRFFLRLTGGCAVLLPLAAMGWVCWQAVDGYYQSALSHTGFLGADFAIHSTMVVAIAWLLPFFLHRQLKPSAERTARKGLRNGVGAGLARIQTGVDEALEQYGTDRRAWTDAGEKLLAPAESSQRNLIHHEMLERMIPAGQVAAAGQNLL